MLPIASSSPPVWVELISGKAFDSRVMSQNEFDRVFDHVNNNFFFIYPEDDVTIENILDPGEMRGLERINASFKIRCGLCI